MSNITAASPEDAEILAHLINQAGEGLPMFLWSLMAEEDEHAVDVGIRRAQREEGGFSYRNAKVYHEGQKSVGMMISYHVDSLTSEEELASCPEVVRPLCELENRAIDTWYINAVATSEQYRGRGIASALLKDAEEQALRVGLGKMSLIVASENITAKKLYLKLGYECVGSLPVVRYPGAIYGGEWELMVKCL